METVPEKPTLDGIETRWSERWEAGGVYRFDRTATRDQVFSIDTPPPTASGELHLGHVFSYTHTDTVARYRRMRGHEVFYPMGWDDNGLPTERRVQNYYGVRCDPSLPYDPEFTPPAKRGKHELPISRANFVELCETLLEIDEQAFEDLWRRLGLSVDWSMTYATIDDHSRRASQRAFLRNLARGEAYQADAPTLWDITFRTAVAQAELEDRDKPSAYHKLAFHKPDGSDVHIDTTRPELLAACVALVAHPDDDRYRDLVGSTVTTPIFAAEVPVVAHELADPEKGTGVAMICTFGDTTDVTWWRELDLPMRPIVERSGRISDDAPDGVDAVAFAEIAGKTVNGARERTVEMLTASGELVGEPEPITHAVKFYERGERPLEIVTSRQWYIRNGGRDDDLRHALLGRGDELNWVPSFMQGRYDSWVEGLNGDWLISRQRFFGIPFPVWYRLGPDGQPDTDNPIVPAEDALPIDPASEAPPGYDESQRGKPSGFMGDPDVMDTWATSSLTPQIVTGWIDDPDLHERTFPMDLRPQGPEILRTWLFSSAVRAHFEHGELPWSTAAISGWVLDPDRKKMSKSKGNVVTPMSLLEQYGSDAVRYWAASGRPGTDTAVDEAQIKVGRRLAIKLLNASKFVLGLGEPTSETVTEPLDLALLVRLASLVDECTRAFEDFDYARSLERTETFFWSFTDDYVELVKNRAYGAHGEGPASSARATLRTALSTLQRLFAPIVPFVAEEVWSWWQEGSIHRTPWPTAEPVDGNPEILAVASEVLSEIRGAKSEAKQRLSAPVAHAVVRDTDTRLELLGLAARDVADAGRVDELTTELGPALNVDVKLADT